MNENIKKFLEELASFDEEEPYEDVYNGEACIDDYAGGNVDDAFSCGTTRGEWEVKIELAAKAFKLLESL